MKKIIILFIMLLSLNLFAADLPCIKIYRTGIYYTNLDIFKLQIAENDTFTIAKTNGITYTDVKTETLIGADYYNFTMSVFDLIGGYTSIYEKTSSTFKQISTNNRVDYNIINFTQFFEKEKPVVIMSAEAK